MSPPMSAGESPTTDRPEDTNVPANYSRKVGDRLRAIRRQQKLSLQDVEAHSDKEFKASVLGAYERGERAISVPRLQRLARFYKVPVDQLLPSDEGPDFRTAGSSSVEAVDLAAATARVRRDHDSVKIDLRRLEELNGSEAEMLSRYLGTIQMLRQDYNGRVLTIRRDDLWAIAAILGVSIDSAPIRLDDLGLCSQHPG
jgi:transcriptional regulator with XRE-family HTH domain